MGYPLLGTRETWVVSTIPWPLFSRLTPYASRSTLHARPAGLGHAQTFSRWRLHATDRRIGKDRTGPDLDERPLYLSMSPKQAIPAEKINPFLPTRCRPTVDHSLAAEDAQRQWLQAACRIAISRNACSLPDFPEFAQAVKYGVPRTQGSIFPNFPLADQTSSTANTRIPLRRVCRKIGLIPAHDAVNRQIKKMSSIAFGLRW